MNVSVMALIVLSINRLLIMFNLFLSPFDGNSGMLAYSLNVLKILHSSFHFFIDVRKTKQS